MLEFRIKAYPVNSKLFTGEDNPYSQLPLRAKWNDPTPEENLRDLEFMLQHFDKIVKVSEEVVSKWEKEFVYNFNYGLPELVQFTKEENRELELAEDRLFAKYFDVDITKEYALFIDYINDVPYHFLATQN